MFTKQKLIILISIAILLSLIYRVYNNSDSPKDIKDNKITTKSTSLKTTKKSIQTKDVTKEIVKKDKGTIEVSLFDGRVYRGSILQITKEFYEIKTANGVIRVPAVKVDATRSVNIK